MFADIIIPVPVPQLFTYQIPLILEKECTIGKRVTVPFGKSKIYSGIVAKIHQQAPLHYEVKEIIGVLDSYPIVNNYQLELWSWLSQYYMCSLGEVYRAALPAGLKLESETKISLNQDIEQNIIFSEKEEIIIQQLKIKSLLISDLDKITKTKTSIRYVHSLLKKGVIEIEEHLENQFKAKTETHLFLHENIQNNDDLQTVFVQLEKTPKQLELFMKFLQKIEYFSINQKKSYKKEYLLKESEISAGTLKSLEEKKILVSKKVEIDRLDFSELQNQSPKALSDAQEYAYNQIVESFEKNKSVLLHGVTSSGKTEIYIKLIEKYIKEGKQVLYLLPEIALTAQIINRLKINFGNKVGVYHSKYSDNERVEIWNSLLGINKNQYSIIIGVRSAIFLPFSNLGLIIVDEEHDNNYKQNAPAPRYHARDVALVLAKMHNSNVLLGTATPSIESYFNTQTNRFQLVKLSERFGNVKMPEILVVNVLKMRKMKQMKGHFSNVLIDKMKISLENGKQTILFQNRRGFSPYLECSTCGWIPKCEFCDVSLTYYKFTNKLVCHYCGFTVSMPSKCLACGDSALQTQGFGTEKIESDISLLFPDYKIDRMDWDTTRTKNSYLNIIKKFENKQIDVLIGTQMITKGLDFDNVNLVGILNADNLLNFPDFRAHERSFQLITQVSGRAGRRDEQGIVIIQTTEPEHFIIQQIVANDYENFYQNQIRERERYRYPPFYRLILITLKHKNLENLNIASNVLARHLQNVFNDNILGPEFPPINRIQNFYLKNILIKIERVKSHTKVKSIINQFITSLKTEMKFRDLKIIINIDPS